MVTLKLVIAPANENTKTINGIYHVYMELFLVFKKHQIDMNREERRNLDGVTYLTILSNLRDNRNECQEINETILITY